MKILYQRAFFLFFFNLFLNPVKADEMTHQLGNSGYALRWAMQEGASQKSPEHYWKAVALQRRARVKFSDHALREALTLSQEAEKEAHLALKDCGVELKR